jgi:hypothetical protein
MTPALPVLALIFLISGFAASGPVRPGVYFEPNVGQAPPEARFVTRTSDSSIQVSDRRVVIHRRFGDAPIRLDWIGSQGVARWSALEPTGGVSNCYTDRVRAAGVPHFGAYAATNSIAGSMSDSMATRGSSSLI